MMSVPGTGGGNGVSEVEREMVAADRLLQEGADWVSHLLSGTATRADVDRLAHWRARSPQHEAAYRETLRLLRAVEGAALEYRARLAVPDSIAADTQSTTSRRRERPAPIVSRRWVLSGALSASAAGALVLGSWSSLRSPRPDYRTGKGERRTLALGTGLEVVMNTLTRLSVNTMPQGRRIELIDGQAVVTAALSEHELVQLDAGVVRALARQARFDVRHDEGEFVCVTCLTGQVTVQVSNTRVSLDAGEQVAYDKNGIGKTRRVDSAVVSSWQSGMLIFHNQPLSAVIAEVNRYRPGRIIIGSAALGRRTVEAVVFLEQMQDVVQQVQQLSGAHVTHLPGGVVILT